MRDERKEKKDKERNKRKILSKQRKKREVTVKAVASAFQLAGPNQCIGHSVNVKRQGGLFFKMTTVFWRPAFFTNFSAYQTNLCRHVYTTNILF